MLFPATLYFGLRFRKYARETHRALTFFAFFILVAISIFLLFVWFNAQDSTLIDCDGITRVRNRPLQSDGCILGGGCINGCQRSGVRYIDNAVYPKHGIDLQGAGPASSPQGGCHLDFKRRARCNISGCRGDG